MLNKLSYYLLVIVAIMVAACSDVEEILSPAPDQSRIMSFNIGNQTKVSTDDITSQEFIIYDYIYGAEGYQDGTCYIDGSKVTLKYRDGSWGFFTNIGDTRVDFLWTETGEHRFYAFNKVEYQVSMAKYQNTFVFNDGNPYILFGTNVNTKNEVKDVVYSTDIRNVDNSSEPYSPINLKFSHFFSSIKIEVKNVSGEAQNITNFQFEGLYSLSNEYAKVYFNGGSNLSFDSTKGKYSSSDVRLENGQSWFPLGVNPIMVWPQSFSTGHNPFFKFKSNDNDKFLLFTDIGVGQWQSGKLHHITLNLAPDPVRLNPEVEITHVMNDDGTTPKYSDVSISLNPTGDKFERLENLRITVLDSSGNPTGLAYSSQSVTGNSLEIYNQNIVLTPGESFTVKFEYSDKLSERSNEVVAKSPLLVEPEYNYVYADGSQGNEVEGKDIVGVIIYHGDPGERFEDTSLPDDYCNGLAISLKSRKCLWNETQLSTVPDAVKVRSTTNLGGFVLGGYTTAQQYGSNSYTVFDNGVAPSGTSGWYLPAANEWIYINDELSDINTLLLAAGGEEIILRNNQKADAYWLPYFYSTNAAYIWRDYNGNPTLYHEKWYYSPGYEHYVRPIFAF